MIERPPYFPYVNFLDLLKQDLQGSRIKEVTIVGGRGLGKTTVAESLANVLPAENVVILPGRSLKDCREKYAANKALQPWIVVDDADYLLEEKTGGGLDFVEELLTTIKWHEESRVPIVMTAENVSRLYDAAEVRDTCSAFVLRAVPRNLEPWLHTWKADIRSAVRETIDSDSHRLIDAWVDVIEKVTGGHPSLVNHALIVVRGSSSVEADTGELNPKVMYTYLFSQLEDDAEKLVEKAVRDYEVRRSEDLMQLIAAAKDRAITPPRSALQTGMAYSTPLEGIVLADGLIREFVSRLSGQARIVETIEAVTDPKLRDRGELVVLRNGIRTAAITLSGAVWRLFKQLHAAHGETVSVATMKSSLRDRQTDAALTSALQRLRSELKSVNLSGSLQNVHGQGYRWVHVTANDDAPQ